MANRIKETVKKVAELRPDKGEYIGSVIHGWVVHEFPNTSRVRFRDHHGNSHIVARKLVRVKRSN